MYIERPYRGCCFTCGFQHLDVESPQGTSLGQVTQDFTLIRPCFTVTDQAKQPMLFIRGPFLNCRCRDIEFKVSWKCSVLVSSSSTLKCLSTCVEHGVWCVWGVWGVRFGMCRVWGVGCEMSCVRCGYVWGCVRCGMRCGVHAFCCDYDKFPP